MANLFFPLAEMCTRNKGISLTFLQHSLYCILMPRNHTDSISLCCWVWDGQELENQPRNLTGYFLEDLSICEGCMMLSRGKKVPEP